MKKIFFTLIFALASALICTGQESFDSHFQFEGKLGMNIGAYTPLSIPATIRGLEFFHVQPNVCAGLDIIKPISDKWNLIVGGKIENKDMKIATKVKNHKTEVSTEHFSISGNFTGNVSTVIKAKMFTIPACVCYKFDNMRMRFGPYMSVLFMEKEFKGEAYNGYLREKNPTGLRIEISESSGIKGDYDFSKSLMPVQFGLMVNADWFFMKKWGIFGDLSWGVTSVTDNNVKLLSEILYPIFGTVGIVYKFSE